MDQAPMEMALKLARKAFEAGEVPVGAVILSPSGEILAKERNRMIECKDPTAHAEILALRSACQVQNSERLVGCSLYVTLEPCTMCAAAISFARIAKLYFGAYDPKGGGVEQGACFFDRETCHHAPQVYGGFYEKEASTLLIEFFRQQRVKS